MKELIKVFGKHIFNEASILLRRSIRYVIAVFASSTGGVALLTFIMHANSQLRMMNILTLTDMRPFPFDYA